MDIFVSEPHKFFYEEGMYTSIWAAGPQVHLVGTHGTSSKVSGATGVIFQQKEIISNSEFTNNVDTWVLKENFTLITVIQSNKAFIKHKTDSGEKLAHVFIGGDSVYWGSKWPLRLETETVSQKSQLSYKTITMSVRARSRTGTLPAKLYLRYDNTTYSMFMRSNISITSDFNVYEAAFTMPGIAAGGNNTVFAGIEFANTLPTDGAVLLSNGQFDTPGLELSNWQAIVGVITAGNFNQDGLAGFITSPNSLQIMSYSVVSSISAQGFLSAAAGSLNGKTVKIKMAVRLDNTSVANYVNVNTFLSHAGGTIAFSSERISRGNGFIYIEATKAITGTSGSYSVIVEAVEFEGKLMAILIDDVSVIDVGVAGQTVDIDIDLFSAKYENNQTVAINTEVSISPAWSISAPESYVGDYLIFDGGNNDKYGSVIKAITTDGMNAITKITLSDPFFNAPSPDSNIYLAKAYKNYYTQMSEMYSIGQYCTAASIESEIQTGFSRATITLAHISGINRAMTVDFSDWMIAIGDEYGTLWEGYISRYSYNGDELTLECLGMKNKLSDTYYAGYFDSRIAYGAPQNYSVPLVTAIVVRDILVNSHAVDRAMIDLTPYPQLASMSDMSVGPADNIDRDRSIAIAQMNIGGIGVQDFTDDPITCADALEKMLTIGTFDDSYDTLVLQIWERGTPVLRRIPKRFENSTPNWLISNANVVSGHLEYVVDRSGFKTIYSGIYRASDGTFIRTSPIFNLKNIERFGFIEQVISNGNLSRGEMELVLESKAQDVTKEITVGNIVLNGLVTKYGNTMKYPASAIRAGDVLYLPVRDSSTGSISSSDTVYDIVIAGAVESDLVTGETRITPWNSPENIEYTLAQLDLQTGG